MDTRRAGLGRRMRELWKGVLVRLFPEIDHSRALKVGWLLRRYGVWQKRTPAVRATVGSPPGCTSSRYHWDVCPAGAAVSGRPLCIGG